MYTTETKALDIIEIEQLIRNNTETSDKILFLDNVPFGYLMSNGIPWAPSTWDLTGYTYGFDNDNILYRYFENKGAYPDKIIYLDFGRDDLLSIDVKRHSFNQFVNSKYDFRSKTYIGDRYEIRLYEKKN